MSVPSSVFNLQKASTYLILIIGFVKCIPPPTFPQSSYFNFNITSEPERFDEDNCPPLEPIENGNFLIKEYMGQRAAFISCNKNFTLVGKSIIIIVCDNGIWKSGFDEIFPKCEKRCPPPPYLGK